MSVINITSQNFEEEVTKSSVPVLIDFWAPWCGPCKMMAPVVEEIAKEVGGTAKVGKVNIDEEPNLASSFGVMSIPTFVVVRGGKVVGQTVGVQGKEDVLKLLH